jgi:hypothetical protein
MILILTLELCSISDYKKFSFRLDEESLAKVTEATKDFPGKSPIKQAESGNYLSVGLNRFDKVKSMDRYEKLRNSRITFTCDIKAYSFSNPNDVSEELTGWSATLIKIIKTVKFTAAPGEAQQQDEQKLTATEAALEALQN